MQTRETTRRPLDIDFDVEDEDRYYVTRPHTSARRYDIPARRDTLETPVTETGAAIQRRRSVMTSAVSGGVTSKAMAPSLASRARHAQHFPLIAIVLGMMMMALLAVTFSAIGSWWQIHQQDVTYGRPRTFQVDAVVGHNDSPANPSHFIFLNLNRHVVIIELPGGDPAHARIYSGPTLFGDGQDLTPVTAEFRDVNGDGRPDMIVHIQDQTLVYINDGTQFRPMRPGEQVNLG
ncbi:MAG TPA: hypothetical protein VKR83_13390 [Ktedonobacteraceae bacterium]|nr:hypothetical protein [Ktedonobacteraceae bacterium]